MATIEPIMHSDTVPFNVQKIVQNGANAEKKKTHFSRPYNHRKQEQNKAPKNNNDLIVSGLELLKTILSEDKGKKVPPKAAAEAKKAEEKPKEPEPTPAANLVLELRATAEKLSLDWGDCPWWWWIINTLRIVMLMVFNIPFFVFAITLYGAGHTVLIPHEWYHISLTIPLKLGVICGLFCMSGMLFVYDYENEYRPLWRDLWRIRRRYKVRPLHALAGRDPGEDARPDMLAVQKLKHHDQVLHLFRLTDRCRLWDYTWDLHVSMELLAQVVNIRNLSPLDDEVTVRERVYDRLGRQCTVGLDRNYMIRAPVQEGTARLAYSVFLERRYANRNAPF